MRASWLTRLNEWHACILSQNGSCRTPTRLECASRHTFWPVDRAGKFANAKLIQSVARSCCRLVILTEPMNKWDDPNGWDNDLVWAKQRRRGSKQRPRRHYAITIRTYTGCQGNWFAKVEWASCVSYSIDLVYSLYTYIYYIHVFIHVYSVLFCTVGQIESCVMFTQANSAMDKQTLV